MFFDCLQFDCPTVGRKFQPEQVVDVTFGFMSFGQFGTLSSIFLLILKLEIKKKDGKFGFSFFLNHLRILA